MPSIPYQKGEWPMVLSDTINLSDEEFSQMSEQDIEQIKEERYQNWLTIINTPFSEEVISGPSEEDVDG